MISGNQPVHGGATELEEAAARHRAALQEFTRVLNETPEPILEPLRSLADFELEIIFRNRSSVGFPARVAAAHVYMERITTKINPDPNPGFVTRCVMAELDSLASGNPHLQADALITIQNHISSWLQSHWPHINPDEAYAVRDDGPESRGGGRRACLAVDR